MGSAANFDPASSKPVNRLTKLDISNDEYFPKIAFHANLTMWVVLANA